MKTDVLYPRFCAERLREILSDSPVALVHGPRQCGKTTLARLVGDPLGYTYFSFDDQVSLQAARADPLGFVADLPERVILDEVQLVPEVLSAIKSTVDRQRRAGRFILTGSSNVLLVPQLSSSLVGRVGILRLHPLAQCELVGRSPRFLESLFAGAFKVQTIDRLGSTLVERLVAGGYPAALTRKQSSRRQAWYRDYVETLVQRDVRDMTRIRSLDVLPRLLAFAASQTARLLNVSDLTGPFRISRPTIADYVTLLERLFLLELLPPWHSNRLSRLVKTPKMHLGDSGTACALLGVDAPALAANRVLFGQLLETFVYGELRRQASWHERNVNFFHFRDKDGGEVDLVLERAGQEMAAVEVKASATVTAADFRSLGKLRRAAGKHFRSGVVLYDGETCAGFGEGLFAVPLRLLWEG